MELLSSNCVKGKGSVVTGSSRHKKVTSKHATSQTCGKVIPLPEPLPGWQCGKGGYYRRHPKEA